MCLCLSQWICAKAVVIDMPNSLHHTSVLFMEYKYVRVELTGGIHVDENV